MNKKNLLLVLFTIVFITFGFAQTWNGSSSTDWNTPANWTPAMVPTATGNVIIPGSLATYPSLANNVTINSLNMQAGSELDFKGFTLTITNTANYTYFIGAILKNSNPAGDIVINIMGTGGYAAYIRGTTVNDNITFNISATNTFNDGDVAGTGNHYTGNVNFNCSGTGALYISEADTSLYDGNLTINRTGAGLTEAFNSGGIIGGNFAFTNNTTGNSLFGNLSTKTSIGGTVNISINDTTPNLFQLHRLVNQTTGGNITVQNTKGFDIKNDTLAVTAFSVTGYRGSSYAYLFNNRITGNVSIDDDATYGGGYVTYIRNNEIIGTASFSNNGSNTMTEADAGNTGNHYTGNVSFNCSGIGGLYISDADTSRYDANLTINRTGAGITQAFNSGGVIGGNFAFTNNAAGNCLLGNIATKTNISGTVNITINDTIPTVFQLYHLVNQTGGGTINVQNTKGFDIQNDTLIVTAFSGTGYRGNAYAYLLNNSITGNVTIADDASYTSGYATYIRNNQITGTAAFSNNGSNILYEADIINSGNHFTGNVSFNCTGTGGLYISDADTSLYDANLTITRTAAAITQAFNSGGVIGGNFAFINNTAGNCQFGNLAIKTSIAGMVNISINNITPGVFQLYRLVNQTGGGNINAQNTRGIDIQNDTLIVTAFSATGYRGSAYAYLFNNSITGNVTLADDATYTSGYATYIRNNQITGTATFSNKGSNVMYESDIINAGNHYTGNVSFTCTGAGGLYISDGDTSLYDANLTITRTGAALTQAFNSGGVIGGNFSYTNNTAGNSLFGNLAKTTNIAGTVNITVDNTTPDFFQLHRLVNLTGGGTINAQNTRGIDIKNDTLIVTALSATGYRGSAYAYLYNSNITGDVTLADDATYGGGYATYIRDNIITGNSSFTNNGSNVMYDSDGGTAGNKYKGSVSYTKNGGAIDVGATDTIEIAQNLTLNSSTGITLGKIKFNGSTDGTIEQLGIQPVIIPQLIMEKSITGKVTLNDSVTITTSLFFNGGNLVSTPSNKLIFLDNATHTGASDQSHVNGYVQKTGNDAFSFPTGTATTLNAVSMTAPATGSIFTAQYFLVSPSTVGDTSLKAPSLKRISGCEYWDIKRDAGNSNVSLTFDYGDPCNIVPIYINDPTKINIAHWTGSIWEDLGNGGSTGTTSGTVTTAAAVSNFSPFTFGSTDVAINPVPVQLISFNAAKQQQSVSLNWKTENEINFSHFDIERSVSDNRFISIGTKDATNLPVVNQYTFSDFAPRNGINFYRLKMVDLNGRVTYSKTEAILFGTSGSIIVYPNPVKNAFKIVSSSKISLVMLTDISGKTIKTFPPSVDQSYNVAAIQPGIYMLQIVSEEGKKTTKIVIE